MILPTIDAELGRPWKDPMAYTLRSIDVASAKRYNKRWLSKKMVKQGDAVSRALAGSLAASEEDWSTVSVFKNPLFGNAAISTRKWEIRVPSRDSKSQQSSIATSPLRSCQGWAIFLLMEGGFVYTGTDAKAPKEWVGGHRFVSVDLKKGESGYSASRSQRMRWTQGLPRKALD